MLASTTLIQAAPLRVLLCLNDVTSRKRAERQLRVGRNQCSGRR